MDNCRIVLNNIDLEFDISYWLILLKRDKIKKINNK
jgi:hypothetical protein